MQDFTVQEFVAALPQLLAVNPLAEQQLLNIVLTRRLAELEKKLSSAPSANADGQGDMQVVPVAAP